MLVLSIVQRRPVHGVAESPGRVGGPVAVPTRDMVLSSSLDALDSYSIQLLPRKMKDFFFTLPYPLGDLLAACLASHKRGRKPCCSSSTAPAARLSICLPLVMSMERNGTGRDKGFMR